MIPELGDNEVKTKEYIKNHIQKLSHFEIIEVLDTGLIAVIRNNNSKVIALRADMDGLPIEEVNDVYYKSKHEGLMHACGHDVHMAILLGVANILDEMWDQLNIDVKLIFQPAEETTGGAKRIIKSGILNDVSAVFGLHVDPHFQVGEVLYTGDEMYSSSTAFNLDVYGDSVHIAFSNDKVNAVLVSIKLLEELFAITKEYDQNVLLGVGKVSSGVARNIMPENVHLECTLRINKINLYDKIKKLFIEKIREVEELYKTKIIYKSKVGMFFGDKCLKNNTGSRNRFHYL